MINPLAQRQMHQTANIEAVRQAHEVSGQIQREAMKQRALEDSMAEEQGSVRVIPESEQLRLEERKGGGGGQEEAQSQSEEASQEEETPDAEDKAGPADSHLDFLA